MNTENLRMNHCLMVSASVKAAGAPSRRMERILFAHT